MKQDRNLSLLQSGAALLLLFSFTACGGGGDGGGGGVLTAPPGDSTTPAVSPAKTPTVLANTPTDGALDVPLNGNASATFSEAMDPATLTASTFTVTSGAVPVLVPGTVIYDKPNAKAVFQPSVLFSSNSKYTATITTGAKSVKGAALAAMRSWSFTTGTTLAALLPVNLGTAGNFVILAKTGISTVPTSAITGNLGVSPAAATYITGFSQTADATNVFSKSPQVNGKIYASNYAVPTPSNLTTAVGDMQTAFTNAAGRAPYVTELGAGDISGMTLPPGVYKWGSGLKILTGDLTLVGSATDVWIFQIAQGLTVGTATKAINIVLTGGAVPKNIFWQVSGAVALSPRTHLEGVVLSQTAIALKNLASINGRLLAQTAVTLDANTVVEPAP